jgi:ATP-binding cassette subfamily C protein CydD
MAGTDRRLWREARGAHRALRATVVLGVLAGLAVIVQAALIARVVDRAAFHDAGLADVAKSFIALAAVFLLRAVLAWAGEVVGFRAAAAVKLDLRRRLVANLLALGPVHAVGERSGDLAGTMLEGVEALDPYFSRYLPQVALVAVLPAAILAAIFPVDWVSALVLLISGPLIPVFMVFVGGRAEAINRRQWRQLLLMGTHFLDAVQGLTTLKLFGRARAEIALVGRISDDYRRTTMESLRIAFLTSAVLEFFASLSIALVAVLFGARLLHGQIDFYPAFLVLLLVPEFFLPLRGLATHYHARMSALAAAARIFDLLDTVPPQRAERLTAPAAPISFVCRGVQVGYAPGRAVLRGVDCDIQAGRMTALVGASGAGKTTLATALLGFLVPTEGEILVNGAVRLDQLDPADWWRRLAYVPQAPRLFAGTVAANLRLARPGADLPALERAAMQAGALGFIEALPRGFETELGEGGAGLSGGQVQRLALARAFLKDAPLLILDEATANLDPDTEADLVAAIAALVVGRTAVVIAHRLATVERADQILVLDQGRVVEAGAHAALVAAGGIYADMLAALRSPACAT